MFFPEESSHAWTSVGSVAVSGKEQKYQSDQVKHLPHLQHNMGTSYLFRLTWDGGIQNISRGPYTLSAHHPEY